jgi:hypothetical protein
VGVARRIIKLFPAREGLVCGILAGKSADLFYSVWSMPGLYSTASVFFLQQKIPSPQK